MKKVVINNLKVIGLIRQPGWLSLKSCKILRILLFFSGSCSETEVSEQLYSIYSQ